MVEWEPGDTEEKQKDATEGACPPFTAVCAGDGDSSAPLALLRLWLVGGDATRE